ncbi:MAG: TldD/PmbA family protein [Candidatus Heimdallarchaeota archaeon]|nr:TldD/PmbA family protein [Candidatus Heimdallarchaeota archaeon]
MSLEDIRNKVLGIADQTVKYARDLKVPSAEIFVIEQSTTSLTDNKGKVDSRDGIIQGIGIRAAIGKQLGFASSTGFEDETLKSTLQAAYNIAKVSPENPMFNGFVAETKTAKEGILDSNILNLEADDLIEKCNIMNQEVDLSDKRIISGSFGSNISHTGYAIGTTEGCLASSLTTSFSANSYFVVTEAGDRKTAGDFINSREIKSVEGIAPRALNKALSSLGSKAFGGSEVLPTVWEAREAASFLAFAFFNVFSGTTYVEKSNPWSDKLNEQVASKELTVIDDGQKPDTQACHAIDSEGTPKQTTTIIKEGILQTFLFNKMYGEVAGFATTGNAQRGGPMGGAAPYESTPSVGFNQILVEEVAKNLNEQIAEMDRGILITGTPIGLFTANPVTGDFSVTCNDTFLIENGEKVHPLKSVSIAGNYFETLNNIRFIGNDREPSGWPIDTPSMTFTGHTISD